LPENDPVLLAALVAPFTYDREPDGRFSRVRAPNWLRYQFNKMIRVIEPLIIRKKESGFSTNQISFKIALTVYLWASGKPWKDVSLQMEMAEGDLCMLILRTIDNLRQIASLEETHPDVAGCAFAAIDTLMREPVSLL